tara:strand:- start:210 stop:1286 length:1077 start_codon:yes stop_codon:yes gene_type:complete
MNITTFSSRKLLLAFLIIFSISCSSDKENVSSEKSTWSLSDGVEFPKDRPLARAEDGVMLSDGTLIVADQRYGLVKVDKSGAVEPFGNFQSIGYKHNPPEIESGPNGVHFSPDKTHIFTADVFSGHIYMTSIEDNKTKIIHSHRYGVNTAIQDSLGNVWFTQSTENNSESRLFEAIGKPISDGIVYRLPLLENGTFFDKPELVVDGMDFANGFYIDEKNNKFYLSETMANRVLSFDLDIEKGELTNRNVLAKIPSPDNMQLNHDGFLWVASPLSNQIHSINILSGDHSVVFDAQTQAGTKNMEKGLASVANGEGILDFIEEDTIGDMPGLLTGMIIGDETQPFYVANLGAALIKVSSE